MPWNEDRLHRWLARGSVSGLLRGSPAHDACVLTRPGGREVLCTDQVVLGVHCTAETNPKSVGRKAAARALSDLAATAATPRALMLAVRADREVEEAVIRDWIRGVREVGAQYGAALAAGDLACAPGPSGLCVSAIGEYSGKGRPPGRDRARAGDWILLTGPVGGSALGRHLRIRPRLNAGRLLHFRHRARALMDVSDGLAWDLYRLARASKVRAHIEHVPIHKDALRASEADGEDPLLHALHDGEDHELLAVMTPSDARRAMSDPSKELANLTFLGRMEDGQGLKLGGDLGGDRDRIWSPSEGGWRHGD